jgi:TPR repeat protein
LKGEIYERGQGVKKDLAMAIKYYRRALKLGFTESGEKLAELEKAKTIEKGPGPGGGQPPRKGGPKNKRKKPKGKR